MVTVHAEQDTLITRFHIQQGSEVEVAFSYWIMCIVDTTK